VFTRSHQSHPYTFYHKNVFSIALPSKLMSSKCALPSDFQFKIFMVVEKEYSGVELRHKTMKFEDCRVGWLRSESRERVR